MTLRQRIEKAQYDMGLVSEPEFLKAGIKKLVADDSLDTVVSAIFGQLKSGYSPINHSHGASSIINLNNYVKAEQAEALGTSDTLLVALGKLEKALDGKQPAGNYASSSHNHDSVYSKLSHAHAWGEITGKPSTFNPSAHNQASNTITAMTGYAKASSVSAIATTDSLNVAIGKLEKALDGKAPTGNYSVVGHNHNDSYNTKAEITQLLSGKLGATANAVSASKLAIARTISVSGAVSGSTTFDGSGNVNISATLNGFDASKITSGTISVDRLPKTAISDFVPVANKAARLALTKEQVQNGDTVKETDTKKMYLVIDDTKLDSEAGYQDYTTVVDWSTIIGKPSTFQPVAHTHTWAQISDRPSTMASPYALTISLNGKAQTAYTGASAVSFNITPASIGAQAAGSYASASHNHDSVYQQKGSYAASSHTHTIGQIGALSGYAKAGSATAITVSDTILTALGKLEKSLDGKQASGSYALTSHTHDDRYYTETEINSKLAGYQPKGSYAAASHGNHVPATQSANNKVYLRCDNTWHTITPADIGAQPAGSYAASNHNHDTVYSKTNHTHSGYLSTGGGTLTGALTVNSTIKATGTVTCSDCVTTSDERLKKDIVKIDKALEKVEKLNGYTFLKYGDEKRTTGVIAQELLEVLPEAVFKREDGYYAVTYGNIVGLLIESIKDLRKENKSLEERLSKLEEKFK